MRQTSRLTATTRGRLATKWKMQGKQPYNPEIVVYASAVSEIAGLLSWATENGVAVTPGARFQRHCLPLPLQGGVTLDLSHYGSSA